MASMADEETIIGLKQEIRPILEKVAHNRQLVSYGELASKVGSKVGIPCIIPRDTRLHGPQRGEHRFVPQGWIPASCPSGAYKCRIIG